MPRVGLESPPLVEILPADAIFAFFIDITVVVTFCIVPATVENGKRFLEE